MQSLVYNEFIMLKLLFENTNPDESWCSDLQKVQSDQNTCCYLIAINISILPYSFLNAHGLIRQWQLPVSVGPTLGAQTTSQSCVPVWPKVWCHDWASALWLLSHWSPQSDQPAGLRSRPAWLSAAAPLVQCNCRKREWVMPSCFVNRTLYFAHRLKQL